MALRVVITGIGVVAPGGVGVEALWETLRSGRSTVSLVTSFDSEGLRCKMAAEVDNFDPLSFLDPKTARRLDRSAQFFACSALMAVEHAGLNLAGENLEQMGIFEGTSLGSLSSILHNYREYLSGGYREVNPMLLVSGTTGAGSGLISQLLKIRGPLLTFSNGSASAAYAIGQAFKAVKGGDVKMALAGGAEAPLCRPIFDLFSKGRMLSRSNETPERACRPFDALRDGTVLGEGGGVLLIEEHTHALRRGAKIYGEIVGFGATSDAYSPIAPDPEGEGLARAIEIALKQAEIEPEQVDYINAHGTSTKLNDGSETWAIKRVFHDEAYRVPISSTKSQIGHLLGACGAVETIATVLAMEHDFIPPTINYQHHDPACDLDYVPNTGRDGEIDIALINKSSFGGRNACIVLRKVS